MKREQELRNSHAEKIPNTIRELTGNLEESLWRWSEGTIGHLDQIPFQCVYNLLHYIKNKKRYNRYRRNFRRQTLEMDFVSSTFIYIYSVLQTFCLNVVIVDEFLRVKGN